MIRMIENRGEHKNAISSARLEIDNTLRGETLPYEHPSRQWRRRVVRSMPPSSRSITSSQTTCRQPEGLPPIEHDLTCHQIRSLLPTLLIPNCVSYPRPRLVRKHWTLVVDHMHLSGPVNRRCQIACIVSVI